MRINNKIGFLTILPLLIAGCNSQHQPSKTDQPVEVITQTLTSTNETNEVNSSGNVEGCKTVRLGFMVAGKVNFIAAEEGQSVRAGQTLASLDPESYKIAKEMADANLDQTQDEYNRLSQMHDRKSLTESDFAKISAALKVAKAQQRLQAKNLADTKLQSPINGILLKKMTEKGEIIGSGIPLFVISDISMVKINASVPETELHNLRIGNSARVYISSIDETFIGKITEIGALAEASTRTFTARIILKNPALSIRPGMTAELKINTGKSSKALTVPSQAILHDADNSSYVYVADFTKMIAIKRKVSPGKIIGNKIEIVSGLTTGDQLIVSKLSQLSNGNPIRRSSH